MASSFWLQENKNKDETKIRATVFLPQKEANRVLFMRKLLASRVLRRGGKNIHLKKAAKSRYSDLFFKSLLAKNLPFRVEPVNCTQFPCVFTKRNVADLKKKFKLYGFFYLAGIYT